MLSEQQIPMFQESVPDIEDKTHPIPFGYDSMLMELQNRSMKAADAMMFIAVNYTSNWKSGQSKYLSIKNLSEMMGISFSYVSKIVKRISRFLKKVKSNRKGTIFNVIHHDFTEALTEEEKKEFARTFAVPYGLGSPIEAMFRGKISWKACLVWIMLKRYSDWTTGLTDPTTMLEIAKRCGLGAQTVCACIRELTEAGFLVRTTPMNEEAVYQLLPKPKASKGKSKKKGYTPKYQGQFDQTRDHIYSFNWQWRIHKVNGNIERRRGYKEWSLATDKEINFEHPYIRNDLQDALWHYNNAQRLRERLRQA